jgi:hypothetical protein
MAEGEISGPGDDVIGARQIFGKIESRCGDNTAHEPGAPTSKKAAPVCCTIFKISDGGSPPIALSPDIGHPVCDALVMELSNFRCGVKECGCSTM